MGVNNDRVTRRAMLGAAAGVATLAGCLGNGGGGGDGDGGGDGGTTTGSTTTQSEPITVGATVPRTGRLSGLGEELEQGYELGVKHINADGGIGGRQVELKLRDDQSEPQNVGREIQQLFDNNDLDMIWGSITTPLVLAGGSFAEREGVPFLGVGFAYEQPHAEKEFEWTYVPYPKTGDIVRANRRLLDGIPDDRKPETVGIWEPNSGWGTEMADTWESELSAAGYDVALRTSFSFGTKDFSSLISQSQSAGVEALFSNPIPPDGITAMKQMQENGFAPKLVEMVRASHSNGWWRALGSMGNYVVTSPGWVPGLTGNGNARFVSGYESEYGSGDLTVPVTVGGAYNLTQTARQAVAAAGSTDPDEVRSALRSETFETVIGSFRFNDDGTLEGDLKTPTGQWWQGEQRLIYPETSSDLAMDLRYPMKSWDQR